VLNFIAIDLQLAIQHYASLIFWHTVYITLLLVLVSWSGSAVTRTISWFTSYLPLHKRKEFAGCSRSL